MIQGADVVLVDGMVPLAITLTGVLRLTGRFYMATTAREALALLGCAGRTLVRLDAERVAAEGDR